ncbi:hypothetical protein ABDJ41_10235 [Pedobacter sp. ASV1-7]|uniref:hypothetical protein n=1 Tax=Pedobacter sp. ASV1-7 TaxID=3145237 RepID=UPI0032E921BE
MATSEGQYKHVVNLGSVGRPFHFLVTSEQIESYLAIARKSVNGYLTIGTFSENGPKKCSGLEIRQYHTTPFNTIQNFLFCSFKRTSAI